MRGKRCLSRIVQFTRKNSKTITAETINHDHSFAIIFTAIRRLRTLAMRDSMVLEGFYNYVLPMFPTSPRKFQGAHYALLSECIGQISMPLGHPLLTHEDPRRNRLSFWFHARMNRLCRDQQANDRFLPDRYAQHLLRLNVF